MEHNAGIDRGPKIVQASGYDKVETFAVAVLDDGSEVRMRSLGDRVEIRTWDPDGECNPPPLIVLRVGRHVIDVRPDPGGESNG